MKSLLPFALQSPPSESGVEEVETLEPTGGIKMGGNDPDITFCKICGNVWIQDIRKTWQNDNVITVEVLKLMVQENENGQQFSENDIRICNTCGYLEKNLKTVHMNGSNLQITADALKSLMRQEDSVVAPKKRGRPTKKQRLQ
jgi:hypothetical protein